MSKKNNRKNCSLEIYLTNDNMLPSAWKQPASACMKGREKARRATSESWQDSGPFIH
jgi:hypothetical protein